jgi:antitoxin HicB
MQYFCKLTPDTGGLTVTFRDIPEALTQGDSVDDALKNAADALMTALEFYFESRVAVPAATNCKRNEHAVNLPVLISAKVALHNEMVRTKKRRADLARELHLVPSGVDRLLDIRHATKLSTIEQALALFGKRLLLTVT